MPRHSILGFLTLSLVAACSTGTASTVGPAPPTGSVLAEDAGEPADADVGPVNGCDTYEDLTAESADRTIVWIRSVGKKCLMIKKGQSITWDPQENFAAHPLNPKNGSAGNPIAKQISGTDKYAVPFPGAGTFGFICGFHFDMTGAIKVVD